MRGVDSIEFYLDGADKYIARVESSMPPPSGGLVNIRGKTYEVKRKTWAVDHANEFQQTAMRCNVDVVPYRGKARPAKSEPV